MIIGDLNVRSHTEGAISAYTAAGFRDLLPAGTTTVAFGDRPFDHVLVPTGQTEFTASVQTVLSLEGEAREQFRVRLSDHFMIVVSIESGADDD